MQLKLSSSQEKAFRKVAYNALKEAVTELSSAKSREEALAAQQKVSRIAIMTVESFTGYIEDDWKSISEDLHFLGDAEKEQPQNFVKVTPKKSKRPQKGKKSVSSGSDDGVNP